MNSIWILAQAQSETATEQDAPVITMEDQAAPETQTLTQAPGGDQTPPPTKPSPYFNLILIAGLVIMMYLVMFRGPRKKQQEHQRMVSSLQKNARVRTIGGILGTVIDVRPDEIVLKIDESNNTKMRVIPSAIATVITEDEKK
jgi:preprotein translocase subunit YajC